MSLDRISPGSLTATRTVWRTDADGVIVWPHSNASSERAMVYWTSVGTHRWLCPSCKSEFARTLSGRPIFLGPGTRTCDSCRAVFKDGSREWYDLGRMEKVRFLVPLEVPLAASICLTSGVAVLAALGVSVGTTLGWVTAILCLLVGSFSIKGTWEIHWFKKRFRASHPFDVTVKARRI